jgi:glutathione-specific gamma-glutamylcyclotransferase
MPYDRENVRGFFRAMLSRSPLPLKILTDEELRQSMAQTLRRRPSPGGDLWVFAYGSLVWRPVFEVAERRAATIGGFRRRFCLSTPLARGTPERPGLMLGLDYGGACRGLALRVGGADPVAELELLWHREMVGDAYVPRWVTAKLEDGARVDAIAFAINRRHPLYAGRLGEAETAARLAAACGELGSCAEYLEATIRGLAACGVADPYLDGLWRRVRALQRAAGDGRR